MENVFIEEEQAIGHITAVLYCNAAGETLRPFIILQAILNLPKELHDLKLQYIQGGKKVRSSVNKNMNKKYLFKLFFYYITYSPSLSITN